MPMKPTNQGNDMPKDIATHPIRLLRIDASARKQGSVSRMLADETQAALQDIHTDMQIDRLDVSNGLPPIDETWVEATFTPDDKRTPAHRDVLRQSDGLVAQLQAADILLIATPVYNFAIPASLKAWIDLVARVNVTFRYTADGPEGLLNDKRAYIVIATGGTEVGSSIDHATGYLRHMLGFLGITDIEFIAADRLLRDETRLEHARRAIAGISVKAPA